MRTSIFRMGVAAAAVMGLVAAAPATAAPPAEKAGPPPGAADCTTRPEQAQAPRVGPIELTEITESAGLLDPLKGMMVHAAAVGDVNGDGWLDLFVGTFADRPEENYLVRGSEGISPDRLMLGGPDGFTADESFPEMYGRTSGSVFADLNNNGELDLVLARNKNARDWITHETLVLRNDGGVFTESTVLSEDMRGRSIAVLDYDGDGLLDLFIVDDHYGSGGDSKLFRNEGDFEFRDVTEEVGLPTGMTGLGAAAADLNGDGLPDILLSGTQRTSEDGSEIQDVQVARMFLNTGGEFQEADASAFQFPTATTTDEVAGLAVADLNRDGLLDVVQASHIHDGALLEQGIPAFKIYLNRGNDGDGAPIFEDVTDDAGIPDAHTRVPHVEIVDLDADGWPDIVTSWSRGDGTDVATFRNLGADGDSVEFETPPGLGDERTTPPTWSTWEEIGLDRYWANGAAADFDRDGRIDVFVSEWFPELPSRLFGNETKTGNGLFVEVAPHNEAIGAQVDVYCPGRLGDPEALVGSRPLTLEVGYGAGLPAELFFGLGEAEVVDVRVTLPNDGGVIEQRGVRADQRVMLETHEAVDGG